MRGDDAIIINYTIWESAESLFEYAYHSAHVEVLRRRREWFEEMREASLALWWVPTGYIASVAGADERLDHLRAHGPTAHAFTFKQRSPGTGFGRTGFIGARQRIVAEPLPTTDDLRPTT